MAESSFTAAERNALLVRIALLTDALVEMRKLAFVADGCEPWYAAEAGIDAEQVYAQAKTALEEDK